jgi:hypothetical protein
MLDKELVLDYLQRTKQDKAVIRHKGRLYLCTLMTDPGNQYADEHQFVRIDELPPVIELVV